MLSSWCLQVDLHSMYFPVRTRCIELLQCSPARRPCNSTCGLSYAKRQRGGALPGPRRFLRAYNRTCKAGHKPLDVFSPPHAFSADGRPVPGSFGWSVGPGCGSTVFSCSWCNVESCRGPQPRFVLKLFARRHL